MQARQGDIFFQTVGNLPEKLKPHQNSILAYGEVTGHSHTPLLYPKVNGFVSAGRGNMIRLQKIVSVRWQINI